MLLFMGAYFFMQAANTFPTYSETILNELMETGVTPIPVSCFLSISLAFLLVITLTFQRAARHP
jgi:hypothetical protein